MSHERSIALGSLAGIQGGPERAFRMKVAERTIDVRCFFPRTEHACRNYLVQDGSADYTVTITREALEAETDQTGGGRGLPRELSNQGVAVMRNEAAAEPAVLAREVARAMLNDGTVCIHGAAIELGGRCYIFTAPSGTGKTTHILNWRRVWPETVIINGDKPLVNVDRLRVYGTPWCGKEGYNTNTSAPLAAIVFLGRGEKNEIARADFSRVFPELLRQTYIPGDLAGAARAYRLVRNLTGVPCFRLTCNMEETSALTARRGLEEGAAVPPDRGEG